MTPRPRLALSRTRLADFVSHVLALGLEEERARLVSETARRGNASLLAVFLLEAVRFFDPSNPDRAAKLARLAILAAEKIEPPGDRSQLLVAAHCRLADSLRRCRRLPQAEQALASAYRVLLTIPTDLEARVRYLTLLALLRRDQGHRAAARALFAQARLAQDRSPRHTSPGLLPDWALR